MALFLLIFGVAIFALFLLGGYALASMVVSPDTINALTGTGSFKLSMFFQAPNAHNLGTFVTCILIMGFIGLMIGLTFFVLGRVYQKMDSVERVSRRAIRKLSHPEE
jgi:hypothetical protein